MNFQGKSCKALFTILMADDDSDDRFLMARAFQELDMDVGLRFVGDGEDLCKAVKKEVVVETARIQADKYQSA